MRGASLLSAELVLLLKQGWIGEVPASHKALTQRLQQYKLLSTPTVIEAFADTDRGLFTNEEKAYANLPHDIGAGEKMTIPTLHAVALEALAPVLSAASRKVLDIGCGAGFLTHCFGKAAPQAQVLGIDLNAKVIERAAKHPKIPPNVTFRRADIKEVIDDEFDAIHVGFNIDQALSDEIAIKLKSGGLMWAPVAAPTGVSVKLISPDGTFREVIDMEYSPMRLPVSEFQDRLIAIDAEIKAIYDRLQNTLQRPITLKDFPPTLQPLLQERKVLQARIKRFSS